MQGPAIKFDVSPSAWIYQLKDAIQAAIGVAPEDQRLVHNGSRLGDDYWSTIQGVGVNDGDSVHLYQVQKGGKPVIYLMPPSGLDVEATVKLSLVPEWELSGIYPVVPITASAAGGQALEWVVKASPNGTLLEKKTGLEVSYLFWEAE